MIYWYRGGSEELTQLFENSAAIRTFKPLSLQAWNSRHKMTIVNDLPEFKSIGCYRTDFDQMKNNTLLFTSISIQ